MGNKVGVLLPRERARNPRPFYILGKTNLIRCASVVPVGCAVAGKRNRQISSAKIRPPIK